MKIKRFFGFIAGAVVSTGIFMVLNALAFAMESGLSFLFGGYLVYTGSQVREEWLTNFHWWHFAIMGVALFVSNLIVRKDDEIVHIRWPERGVAQIGAYIKIVLGLLFLEVLAYLLQFVANAIYVAVTNWAAEVSIENTISLRYLFQKIDFLLIACEAFIAAQFIAFLDRRRRRKLAEKKREERIEKVRFERREKERSNQRRPKLYIATEFSNINDKKEETP